MINIEWSNLELIFSFCSGTYDIFVQKEGVDEMVSSIKMSYKM